MQPRTSDKTIISALTAYHTGLSPQKIALLYRVSSRTVRLWRDRQKQLSFIARRQAVEILGEAEVSAIEARREKNRSISHAHLFTPTYKAQQSERMRAWWAAREKKALDGDG